MRTLPAPPTGASAVRSSLGAICAALDEAGAGRAPASDLYGALLKRRAEIDTETALVVLRCLTGLIAASTGDTPRTILEAEFVSAPSDEFWRGELTVPG